MEYTLNKRLIAAVRKRQALYDKLDVNYCNRSYVNALWKDIAQEISCKETEARKKWTKLRDYFQKNHRHITKDKSLDVSEIQRKWYLHDYMMFLLPHLMEKKSTGLSLITCPSPTSETETDKVYRIRTADVQTVTVTQQTAQQIHATHQPSTQQKYDIVTRQPPEQQKHDIVTHQPPVQQTCDIVTRQPPTQRKRVTQKPPAKRWYTRPTAPPARKTQVSSSHSHSHSQAVVDNTSDVTNEDILETLQLVADNLSKPIDEDEHFFKNLIPKMKILNTVERMECQADIHMIVLRHLRRSEALQLQDIDVEERVHMPMKESPVHDMERETPESALYDCK